VIVDGGKPPLVGESNMTNAEDSFYVVCRDCDLREEYHDETTASRRKLAHHDVRGHVADVEGDS